MACSKASVPVASAPDARAYPFALDELRPFRSYVSISRVGDFAHHFEVVKLEGSKKVIHKVWVDAAGDPDTVHLGQRLVFDASTGRLSVKAERPSAAAADAARRVRSKFPAGSVLDFRGSYREVVVHEVIPVDVTPYRPSSARTRAVLHVNRNFSEIVASPQTTRHRFVESRDQEAGVPAPYWVELPVDNGGRAHLRDGFRLGATARDARVRAAVLAGAKQKAAGAKGPALQTLHARDGARLLPEGIQPALEYRIVVGGAEIVRGRHRTTPMSSIIQVSFDPRDVADGDVESRGSVEYAGDVYHANVHLRLLTDLRSVASPTKTPVDASLTVTVRGPGRQPVVKVYRLRGSALVDGDRIALSELSARAEGDGGFERAYLAIGDGVQTRIRTSRDVLAAFD